MVNAYPMLDICMFLDKCLDTIQSGLNKLLFHLPWNVG